MTINLSPDVSGLEVLPGSHTAEGRRKCGLRPRAIKLLRFAVTISCIKSGLCDNFRGVGTLRAEFADYLEEYFTNSELCAAHYHMLRILGRAGLGTQFQFQEDVEEYCELCNNCQLLSFFHSYRSVAPSLSCRDDFSH